MFVGRTVVKLVDPEELKLELEREQKVTVNYQRYCIPGIFQIFSFCG